MTQVADPTSRWRALSVAGAGLSIACAVHCLVTPFLVAALPFLGSEALESWLGVGLIALAGLAVVGGAVTHKQYWSLLPLALGVGLYLGRHSLGPHGSTGEVAGAIGGSLLLVCAHLLNLRAHRRAHRPVRTIAA